MGRQARRSFRRRLIPRVSFILPVFNVANTVADTLASLSSQTFHDFDVLIYDDGSTDNTAAVLNRFATLDSRFRIVDNARIGLVGALRRLICASDAEFLARIDGDDLCRSTRLEKQISLLEADRNTAAVGCLINSFSSKSEVGPGMRRYTEWLNEQVSSEEISRAVFVESPLCHPSVLMRRDAYENSCGYVEDGMPEDYHLWLDFYALGYNMTKVPEILLDWRDSPGRLSRTDPRYGPQKFSALKLSYLLKTVLAKEKRVTIWGAGKIARRWSRSLTAAGIEITQFIDIDPRKIGRSVHGRPVVPVPSSKSDFSQEFLLAAVASDGARKKISAFLTQLGVSPNRWICAA